MELERLPIDDVLPELISRLREHGQVVLEAPPGAGKSTRVPGALVEAGFAEDGQLWMLEPRRVAVRAIASRVAALDGSAIGQRFGYAVRFERKASAKTQALIVTEGILLRRLQQDPLLEGISCVILDEFHERSVEADLCLAMLREVRQAREDLALVVMSATLQTDALARYLDAPVVRSQGRVHPVEIEHLLRNPTDVIEAAASSAERVLEQRDEHGDMLIFMSGAREIQAVIQRLEPAARRHGVELVPLYGALTLEDQVRAISPSPNRRIIVATNIAETSLTVEGVTVVIDSGRVKQLVTSAAGVDSLEEVQVSLASATQRAGRAGRVRPGRALRLWSTSTEDAMRRFDEAPLMRVDLSAPALEVIAWSGQDPARFEWFEAPPAPALAAATRLLRALGALTPDQPSAWSLSDRGRALLELPTSPRLAQLVLEGQRLGVLAEAATAAALIAEGELRHAQGNAFVSCDLWEAVRAHGKRLPPHIERARAQLVRQVEALSDSSPPSPQDRERAFALAVLSAWPDRVCIQREHDVEHYVMGGSEPAMLARESRVGRPKLLVASVVAGSLHLRHQHSSAAAERALIRFATTIDVEALELVLPQRFERKIELTFDDDRERVMAKRRTRFEGVILHEEVASVQQHGDEEQVARMLARAALRDLWRAFDPSKEDLQLLDRLRFLNHWMPELELPVFERHNVAADLPEATFEQVVQWCWGSRSFAQLRQRPLRERILDALRHDQRQALATHAPTHYALPCQISVRLDYEDPQAPVLAAKIQQLFGTLQTPRIAAGRVALTIHLLGPNYRPAQITQDLESFWRVTYPEVRKELRARYPKHSWPEDPLTAPASKR